VLPLRQGGVVVTRYPQQSEVSRHAKATFRARSDARNEAQNDELLNKLLDAAFSVLHRDAAEGYAATLRKKFARILKIKGSK
jgi:hypothetical protein